VSEQIVDMLLSVQRPASVQIVQRRDNWSRETVRSLRRKVCNLKAQIEARNLGIKERDRIASYWINQAGYWRRKHTDGFGEMSAEQYRMTQRMADLTVALAAVNVELAEYRAALQAERDARLAAADTTTPGRWLELERSAARIDALLAREPGALGREVLEAGEQMAAAIERNRAATNGPVDDFGNALFGMWEAAERWRALGAAPGGGEAS
jgi:hypothetical protein